MANDYRKKALEWIEGDYDESTKEEVKRMIQGNEVELEDAFYRNLEFGTGGLRGLMGVGTNRMNKYTVGMATQGLAEYIKKKYPGERRSVCLGFDSRNNHELFAKVTADVLMANGFDVLMFEDLRPTPELSYAIRWKGAVAGIMLTASHNPKEYNGYKVFWTDGAQVTSPVDKEIVQEVSRITDLSQVKFEATEGAGKLELMGKEVDEAYLNDILSLMLSPEACERHKDLKFVYTPLHGCGVKLVPACLERLGFENVFHVPEQDVCDGNFPTVRFPNPEEPEAMKMALEVAEREKADIVMATDPDADRMGIAVRDDRGKMVRFTGNQTAAMLTYYILTRYKEKGLLGGDKYVVKTIVTTELLAEIAKSFGVKCYNVLTGFKYIAEVVHKNEGKSEFVCGGEESCGFNVGQFVRDKDAQISCAMVAECAAWAAEKGMSLYALMQKIYAEYGYYRESLVYLELKGKKGLEEIRMKMESFRNDPPAEIGGARVVRIIDYLQAEKTGLPSSDVLQFFNENGDVVSVRPSGTEPKIKFYFGAAGADAESKLKVLEAEFVR